MADAENPDAKQINDMVTSLSEWISKQPHLPNIDETLLLKFLVNCKFRLQKTKNKIENYYSARSLLPAYFQNRDPTSPGIRKSAEKDSFFPLSQTTKEDYKIIVFKLGSDPSDFVPEDFMKRMFMVVDTMFHKDDAKLDCIVAIDFRGFSLQHFFRIAPMAKEVIDAFENVCPAKLKGIHYIHVSSHIFRVVEFFKKFCSAKLQKRICVHKDVEPFHEIIGNRDVLPSDLGGKQPSILQLNESYQKKMESYKSWFKEEELIRSNEDLRPPNSKSSWLSGTEGSFKKLSVD